MDTAPQRRLDRAIFNRPTLSVARHLLGKFIVRRDRGRQLDAMITEVEAYRGPRDRASHTFGGRRTARVEPLYAEGGTAYVYLVYGMHWLLNFSTAGAGNPEGVLIRGVLTAGSAQRTLVSGPGRVTSYLCVDRSLDRIDATQSMRMWIEDRDVRVPVQAGDDRTARRDRLRRRVLGGAAMAFLDRPARRFVGGSCTPPVGLNLLVACASERPAGASQARMPS